MDPRYPIGKFEMPARVTPVRRQRAIEEIAATPAKLRAAVKGLNVAGPCGRSCITSRTAT